jgi:hypothetical protein
MPLDALLLEFESLGDDCEFGLVQRAGGVEPLGLFRFAGFHVLWRHRLDCLITAIEERLERLTRPGTLVVELRGEPDRRQEYMVWQTAYNLLYHTFRHEEEITQADITEEQYKVLAFLRRKFLDDLGTAAKIWVFKSRFPYPEEDIKRLIGELRQYGSNRLLWVLYADKQHVSGTAVDGQKVSAFFVHRRGPGWVLSEAKLVRRAVNEERCYVMRLSSVGHSQQELHFIDQSLPIGRVGEKYSNPFDIAAFFRRADKYNPDARPLVPQHARERHAVERASPEIDLCYQHADARIVFDGVERRHRIERADRLMAGGG